MAMSDAAKIGLWVSLSLHALFLILAGGTAGEAAGGKQFVRLSAESLDAIVTAESGALALGAFTSGASDEAKLAERRREAYLQYLEDIAAEIHSRRLDFGRTNLIGIAVFAFSVDERGAFRDIRLTASSGKPELDRVARLAIEASSGRVRRPKLLGSDPIAVVQEVRFQYGLR